MNSCSFAFLLRVTNRLCNVYSVQYVNHTLLPRISPRHKMQLNLNPYNSDYTLTRHIFIESIKITKGYAEEQHSENIQNIPLCFNHIISQNLNICEDFVSLTPNQKKFVIDHPDPIIAMATIQFLPESNHDPALAQEDNIHQMDIMNHFLVKLFFESQNNNDDDDDEEQLQENEDPNVPLNEEDLLYVDTDASGNKFYILP